MDILYIVMPAYNEEANIENTVNEWYPVVKRHSGSGASRLLIIDDGSKDSTGEILDKLSGTRPLMEVIHKKNSGHGSTVMFGYRYALRAGADYVFQTDSDGQTSASEFEPFWRDRKKYLMIIGKRTGRNDGIMRKFVSGSLRQLLLLSFMTYIPDANTPFRLMEASCLKVQLRYISPNEKLPNIMLSAIYLKKKLPVSYRKITFKKRCGGSGSINIRSISRLTRSSMRRFIMLDKRLSREIAYEKNYRRYKQ